MSDKSPATKADENKQNQKPGEPKGRTEPETPKADGNKQDRAYNETTPGGRYKIGSTFVDANGKKLQ